MPMSLPQHNSPSEVVRDSEPGKEQKMLACAPPGLTSTEEFSTQEREQLLRLAHDSIAAALENREIRLDVSDANLADHFAERRGAFTSLYLHGELRGCVGYVVPNCPVYRAVAETARAAAFSDIRFPPVTRDEAADLEVELSILSAPKPIQVEQIEIGRHGLLVTGRGRRGLLLPQVPVEHGWDRKTFLEQTCRKAGLPADAWQQDVTVEAFTAEVFGDKTSHDSFRDAK